MVIYSRAGGVRYELPYEDPLRNVTSAKLQRQHMANDYVQMSVHTTETMPLHIGDYIEVRGCRYSIRAVSDVARSGEDEFTYTITFYGAMYDLMRYKFRNTAINGISSSDTFDLTMNLRDFIKVLLNNVARAEGWTDEECASGNVSWVFDEDGCPETEPITMSFDKQNLLTALQNITTEFDVEFRIEQREVNGIWQKTLRVGTFGDVVNDTPFECGMGKGLYQLQEGKVDDSCIVNRLWAEGGTENILSGYRGYSPRLQLPLRRRSNKAHDIYIDGEKRHFQAGTWIGIENNEKRYVDEDVLVALSKMNGGAVIFPYNSSELIAKYGVIEDSVVFDDVIPTRTFEVKSITNANGRVFTCDVDFNLTAKWLLNYEDFREWCRLKTQIDPTEDEYNDCINFESNPRNVTGWADYRVDVGTNETEEAYHVWFRQHNSAYPYQPPKYNQAVYEQYCIYKDVVNGNNSKYLIDGGQVAFVDGKLAGITFDIGESYTYNAATKRSTITIIQKEDETETVFPSDDEFGAFRMAVGDHFKLVNIYMPYSYYEEAEEELWFKAYEKFESVKYPSYIYRLTFDKLFVDENNTLFASILPGDYITITDDRFGLQNKKMRVSQVDCDLLSEHDYSIILESVHKLKTRNGFYTQRDDSVWQVFKDMHLDDPMYRKNNRVSGATTLHRILDGGGHIREPRVADLFLTERMIATSAVTEQKIGSNAVVSSKIKDGAVVREKIGSKAINTALIDDEAITSAKIARGPVLCDVYGNPVLDMRNGFVADSLRLFSVEERKEREYTLLEDAQNGREIRKFLTGNDTGDLILYTDTRQQKQTTLLSLLGANPAQGLRADVASKANADDVPTLSAFNAQILRVDGLELEEQKHLKKINSSIESLNKAQAYFEQCRKSINQIRTAIADATSWSDLKDVVYRDKSGYIRGIDTIGDSGTEVCSEGYGCQVATLNLGVDSKLADDVAIYP